MSGAETDDLPATDSVPTRREELRTFLLLTVVLAPFVAVVTVGGYGFAIWMSQLIFGPPGS